MKKIIKILFLMLFLISCTSTFKYDYVELKNNVIKSQVIKIDDNFGKEYSTINEINSDRLDDFLLGLSKLGYKQLLGDPVSPKDKTCFRLVYNNGDNELICEKIILKFNLEGEEYNMKSKYTSKEKFDNLLNSFKE